MDIPEQVDGECLFCYLQRIRTLAEKAGLTFSVVSSRHGKHRRRGYGVWINKEKVLKFDQKPKQCECKGK